MNGIVKVLTGILGVMAVVACLATIGIIGYSLTGAGSSKDQNSQNTNETMESQPSEVPAATPDVTASPEVSETPGPVAGTSDLEGHVHDYEETVEEKATCYKPGRLKYICECGDYYYVDIMSTGHVAGEWEVAREATKDREGLRVKKCIYCDEIVAQEPIIFKDENDTSDDKEEEAAHVHQYTASTEREPTCTLAGLRKYTCSCGSFYTEMIPAAGHVATDWTVAEEPTTTRMGREQRTCSVCGVLLDSRPVNVLEASPSASANASANATTNTSPRATGSSPAASAASASPTATAHVHNYQSYVLKEANCTEWGIRSFVCSCGSSYAEPIERDPNNHTYRAVVIPATKTTQGYTVYTCIRCNYSYYDNYTPALGN